MPLFGIMKIHLVELHRLFTIFFTIHTVILIFERDKYYNK